MVVEKIKDKKGEFWCNFAIVGKLMSRHCRSTANVKDSYIGSDIRYKIGTGI